MPFPSPGVLPDPGIKPRSPTLQADTLPSEPPGKPLSTDIQKEIIVCGFLGEASRLRLFVTPWTVARQAPMSMGFFRQEYWSGLPFPSPRFVIYSLYYVKVVSLYDHFVERVFFQFYLFIFKEIYLL